MKTRPYGGWLVALFLALVVAVYPSGVAVAQSLGPSVDGERHSITDDAPWAWFTISPENPRPGQLITFDASSSTGEGGILSYQWDTTGDGKNDRAGAVIRRSYPNEGPYPVTLTVHDGLGRVATLTRVVHVGDVSGVDLSIVTDPPGITVLIDGRRRGETPLELSVEAAKHHVQLRHYWLGEWEFDLDLRNVRYFGLDLVLGHDSL